MKSAFIDVPLFSEPLDTLERDAERILVSAHDQHPSVAEYVMFSGGNDSLVLAHLMRRLGFDGGVFHVDTGIGIRPEVTDFVGEIVSALGLELIIGRPEGKDRYERLLTDIPVMGGFPGGPMHRIAQQRLKGHPTEKLVQDAKQQMSDRVQLYAGRRRHESSRRGQMQVNEATGVKEHILKEVDRVRSRVWVSPLVNWTDAHMYEYRQRHGLRPSEVALELHMSGECFCGSMAAPTERPHLEMVAHLKGGGYADCIDQIRTLETMMDGLEADRQSNVKSLPDCAVCLNTRGVWVPKSETGTLIRFQSRKVGERKERLVACPSCNPDQLRPLPYSCRWAPGGKAIGPSGPMCSSCDIRQGMLFKEAA